MQVFILYLALQGVLNLFGNFGISTSSCSGGDSCIPLVWMDRWWVSLFLRRKTGTPLLSFLCVLSFRNCKSKLCVSFINSYLSHRFLESFFLMELIVSSFLLGLSWNAFMYFGSWWLSWNLSGCSAPFHPLGRHQELMDDPDTTYPHNALQQFAVSFYRIFFITSSWCLKGWMAPFLALLVHAQHPRRRGPPKAGCCCLTCDLCPPPPAFKCHPIPLKRGWGENSLPSKQCASMRTSCDQPPRVGVLTKRNVEYPKWSPPTLSTPWCQWQRHALFFHSAVFWPGNVVPRIFCDSNIRAQRQSTFCQGFLEHWAKKGNFFGWF